MKDVILVQFVVTQSVIVKMTKTKKVVLTPLALEIAKKRYLRTDLEGNILETPSQLFQRVAHHMAKAEINWGSNGVVEKTAEEFYQAMADFRFVCSGKAMFEAGNPGGTGQLSACFVLPIKDSIKSIFKTLGEAAYIQKNNGGTGFNFSAIRPRGDKVKNVPNAASGPVDFLQAYSAALSKILQGAKRRGANMGILNIDHPDIFEFIHLKEEDESIDNFNLSVGVFDKFMEAVEQDKFWHLVNPRTKQPIKRLKAKRLFEEIASAAWRSGDPGMVFLDRMERDNPTPTLGRLWSTNPCGEIPLLPYESCNLTSLVLSRHLKKTKGKGWFGGPKYEIDWDKLAETVRLAVRFLDDMIEVNNYTLPEIERMVRYGNRKIGLGVMGLAHMFYLLGIPYGSPQSLRLAERLAKFIRKQAEEASIELAKERGVFPNFDVSIFAGTAERYRNATLLTVAPTGTISLLANTSSGIEPVFSLVNERNLFYEDKETRKVVITDPIFEEVIKRLYSPSKQKRIIQQLLEGAHLSETEVDKEVSRVFLTTADVRPRQHILMQAAWQKWIDNSVSKTINLPREATVDEVKEAFFLAWKTGCKGITVYRDGSKEHQVVAISKRKKRENEEKLTLVDETICPECGAKMIVSEGCMTCPVCGYSLCKS